MLDMVAFYKENASLLKAAFEEMGFEVHGGTDAPYVWVKYPGKSSWDAFAEVRDDQSALKAAFCVSFSGIVGSPAGFHKYHS